MRSGALQPGDPLPAVRRLASDLGVNPNTVAAAYARLRNAGRLTTAGRHGTRVADEPPRPAPVFAVPPGLRDLASGHVDAALLPTASQLPSVPHNDTMWNAELQSLACGWLQAQGLPQDAMGVFSGTLDAVERALRQHARPGDRVAIEDPCWPPLLALLHSLRLVPVGLPVDAQGVRAAAGAARGLRGAGDHAACAQPHGRGSGHHALEDAAPAAAGQPAHAAHPG